MEIYLPQPPITYWNCQLTYDNLQLWVLPDPQMIDSITTKEMRTRETPRRSLPSSRPQSQSTVVVERTRPFFWVYYIARFGLFEYMQKCSQKSFTLSHQVELIDHIQKMATLKERRIECKKLLTRLSQTRTDIDPITCILLCSFFRCAVAVVDTNTRVYYLTCPASDSTVVIPTHFTKRREIRVMDTTEFTEYTKDYYLLENIEKPLRSISSYRVAELIELATSIDVSSKDEHGKGFKKAVLYDHIAQKISLAIA